jgi:hypothetical protein
VKTIGFAFISSMKPLLYPLLRMVAAFALLGCLTLAVSTWAQNEMPQVRIEDAPLLDTIRMLAQLDDLNFCIDPVAAHALWQRKAHRICAPLQSADVESCIESRMNHSDYICVRCEECMETKRFFDRGFRGCRMEVIYPCDPRNPRLQFRAQWQHRPILMDQNPKLSWKAEGRTRCTERRNRVSGVARRLAGQVVDNRTLSAPRA